MVVSRHVVSVVQGRVTSSTPRGTASEPKLLGSRIAPFSCPMECSVHICKGQHALGSRAASREGPNLAHTESCASAIRSACVAVRSITLFDPLARSIEIRRVIILIRTHELGGWVNFLFERITHVCHNARGPRRAQLRVHCVYTIAHILRRTQALDQDHWQWPRPGHWHLEATWGDSERRPGHADAENLNNTSLSRVARTMHSTAPSLSFPWI